MGQGTPLPQKNLAPQKKVGGQNSFFNLCMVHGIQNYHTDQTKTMQKEKRKKYADGAELLFSVVWMV